MAADGLKRLKKGEVLFRENTPITHLYVVQSGRLSLQVERAGKRLEIMPTVVGQMLGDQGLFTSGRHMFTAEAMQECRLMEVPLETMKTQVNGASAGIKILLKSMVDELKQLRLSMRSLKLETDKSPCPHPSIPRIFSILNLVTRHTGKFEDEKKTWVCDWSTLKLYATRMFAESPQRMRSLLDLLKKLQIADLEVGVSEEGEEELKKIIIFDLQRIEDFAEFYQYNLYKGGYSEVIHVDPLALKVAKALSSLAENEEVDRKGAVTLLYDNVLAEVKKQHGFELKGTHLDVLEKKGLFVKRQSRDDGTVYLSYDKAEYQRMVSYWAVIFEIDKWNDKGFVDLNEKEEQQGTSSGESCPQCSGSVEANHKFCPHCGFKMEQAA